MILVRVAVRRYSDGVILQERNVPDATTLMAGSSRVAAQLPAGRAGTSLPQRLAAAQARARVAAPFTLATPIQAVDEFVAEAPGRRPSTIGLQGDEESRGRGAG